MLIYQSNSGEEFYTLEAAKASVELQGSGNVVTFMVNKNIPFALPEFVYNSVACELFEDGVWKPVSIFNS